MAERTVSDILESLARIEAELKTIANFSADHEARLRELEQKSGKRLEAILSAAIGAVIVGVVGYAIGKLF